MRAFRGSIVLVVVVVGVLVLPAAASAGQWRSEWGPFPTEGPVWWDTCDYSGGPPPGQHARCKDLVNLELFFDVNLEAPAISSTAATLVGYVQPIAGARVTYWELLIDTEGLCRASWQEDLYWVCDEEHQTKPTRVAAGAIVGGNPEELVPVSGSTAVAPEGEVEVYTEDHVGPLELAPDRAYNAYLVENERTPQETQEVDPRGENEQKWGGGEITLVTAPKTPGTQSLPGEGAKKHERREKTRKRLEERRVKTEEHRQRKR
jgi:hypothetical protein